MRSARCARVVECPAGSTSLSGVGWAAAAGQTEFDFDAVVGGKIPEGLRWTVVRNIAKPFWLATK